MKRLGFAVLVAGIVLGTLMEAVPAAAQATEAQQACDQGTMAYERGQLEKAQSGYQKALKANGSASCATTGLTKVTTAMHGEEKLCAEGKQLTKGGEKEEARKRYAKALELNVESQCVESGLAASKKEKSTKDEVSEWSDLIPKISLALGTAIVAFFAFAGFILIAIAAVRRLIQPSLAIKPFSDGALEKDKVGAAVAALVEEELTDLARQSEAAGDGYQLDLVVANVELLARMKTCRRPSAAWRTSPSSNSSWRCSQWSTGCSASEVSSPKANSCRKERGARGSPWPCTGTTSCALGGCAGKPLHPSPSQGY